MSNMHAIQLYHTFRVRGKASTSMRIIISYISILLKKKVPGKNTSMISSGLLKQHILTVYLVLLIA
jgi:hypothetical protein